MISFSILSPEFVCLIINFFATIMPIRTRQTNPKGHLENSLYLQVGRLPVPIKVPPCWSKKAFFFEQFGEFLLSPFGFLNTYPGISPFHHRE
jgi:hypothetical protein